MENDNVVQEPGAAYERPLDLHLVLLMFQETDKKFQETDKKFQETDRQFKETAERFKMTDRKFQETDRKFKETDKKFKETDKKFKETDKKLNKLSALFTTQWGKLMETLVKGDLIKLLKKREIAVERTIERVKGNYQGQNFEYDILAVNGKELVVVEVKTTLRPDDVKDFHEKLWKAKTYMPEYHDKTVFGCVAFLTAEGASDTMAEKLGFFVIKATGSSASIINKEDFKPKAF